MYSAKDQLVKFWDLDIRHCFKTLVNHRSEVCDLFVINDQRLITGCHDNQLRVFKIDFTDNQFELEPNTADVAPKKAKNTQNGDAENEAIDDDDDNVNLI